MNYNLNKGLTFESVTTVESKDTAKTFGSGGIEVYATPMMVGLMENAAMHAVAKELPEGFSTVGIHLDIQHLAATPVGMEVKAIAELVEIDRKKLTFKIEAYDEKELIGKGTHQRYIIDSDKFIQSINAKLK